MIISQNVLRPQHAGAFACGVECMVGGVESKPVRNVNVIDAGCTPAQLALAWTLNRAPFITPIPGTTSIAHLEENAGAGDIDLSDEVMARLDALINPATVQGPRYPASTQPEIDTEELPQAA